jgi:hypothetical protein
MFVQDNRWIDLDIPVHTVSGRKCLFRVERMTSKIDPLPLQEESLKHLSRRGGELQWEAHDEAVQRRHWLQPVWWPLD